MLGMLIGAAVASKMVDAVSETITEIGRNYKHGIQDMVFVNSSASDFYQRNYLDVIRNLLGMGFTNVNASEIRQHRNNFFTRNIYGQVESVTINGDSSFKKGDRFAKGAHVMVSFHVYKDSPKVVIPELQKRPEPSERYYGNYQQPINVNVNINNGGPYGGVYVDQRSGGVYPDQRSQFPNSDFDYAAYGYKNVPSWADEPMPSYHCQYCGSLIMNRDGFCPRCGAPIK